MTLEEVVRNFIASPEFADNNGFIARCYFGIFNDNRIDDYTSPGYRIPDRREMARWKGVLDGMLAGGAPLELAKLAVVLGFTASPEWPPRLGNLDDSAFVEFLYTHILGRASEPGGHAYHLDNLQYCRVTREVLITQFLDSPEAQAKYANHCYVVMAYPGLLDRAPEKAGFDYHVGRLERGEADPVSFLAGFIQAPKYIYRLAALGCVFPY